MNDLQALPIRLIREQHHLAAAVMTDTGDEPRVAQFFAQRPVCRVEKNVWSVNGNAVTDAGQSARQQRDGAAVVSQMVVQMSDALPLELHGQKHRFLKVSQLQCQAAQTR